MNKNILKYAMLLAVGLEIAACNSDDELGIESPMPTEIQQQTSELTFQTSFDNTLQKAGIYRPYINYWQAYTLCDFRDTMSVFSSAENCKFTCVFGRAESTDDYKEYGFASFVGEAKTSEAYYALFPYQPDAKISGNVISAKIPDVIVSDSVTYPMLPEGVLYVGYTNKADRSFMLKNAGAMLGFSNPVYSSDPFKKIVKIEVKASKNIVGDVEITVAEDGSSKISGGTANTVSAINPNEWVYIPILPVKDFDITVTYTCKDGSSFSEEYKGLSASANDILWAGNSAAHTIKFADGILDDKKIRHGDSYSLPDLDKSYTEDQYFYGWKDAQGNEYAKGESVAVYSDMEFSPVWKDGCTVFFDYYYSLSTTAPSYIIVQKGEVITLPDYVVDYSGRPLRGWRYNYTFYNPGDEVVINASTTISAEWNSDEEVFVKPNIFLDADGGTFANGKSEITWQFYEYRYSNIEFNRTDPETGKVGMVQMYYPLLDNGSLDYNNRITEFVPFPEKEGYAVVGIYSDIWSSDESMNDLGFSTIGKSNKDIHIKIKWAKKYYVEYLDANGEICKTDCYTDNNPVFYTDNDPVSVEGKSQIGWKDQDGNVYNMGQHVRLSEPKNIRFTPIFADGVSSSIENWGSADLN